MKSTKNIIFLYSEVVGYLIPVFKLLVNNYGYNIYIIHWDKNKLKPYSPPTIEGVKFLASSRFSSKSLFNYCNSLCPEIIYISGWMDKNYLRTVSKFKKKNIPIITGFDDIWKGNLRQRIGSMIFPFLYKKYFTHAWVAGPQQYEFARRLGFKPKNIIFDLLSANVDVFSRNSLKKEIKEKKNFLYVGNFRYIKGTDILVEAYKIYQEKMKGEWGLICIGNGKMQSLLLNVNGLEIHPYASESTLVKLASNASAFILPSRNDQWGVVVHEFCAFGLAIILSENVGAKSTFLIEGFNGYTFKKNSPEKLAQLMMKIEKMDGKDLIKMQRNSVLLSQRISPKSTAANLLSIIKRTDD